MRVRVRPGVRVALDLRVNVRLLERLLEARARAATRPRVKLLEASARAEMLRRLPRSSVAPKACATSARLMARCGGVWRAMAISLPHSRAHGVRGATVEPDSIS